MDDADALFAKMRSAEVAAKSWTARISTLPAVKAASFEPARKN
jgi:hypothetical protein